MGIKNSIRKSILITMASFIALGFSPNSILAETGESEVIEEETEADVLFEMQSVVLSNRNDDYSGEDTIEYSDESTYTGSFAQGKRSGNGTYLFANGDKYSGKWADDLMSGEGDYQFASGAELSGTFEVGKFKKGTFTYSDDNGKYKVKIKNFKQSKKITATFSNGDVYYGTYNNDSFSGECKILYASGDYYDGQVSDNNKNGSGTYKWANGAVYIGEWQDDMMNGSGTYYFSSDQYPHLEGTFVNNQPSGTCEYYTDENVSITTVWKDGKCVSQG